VIGIGTLLLVQLASCVAQAANSPGESLSSPSNHAPALRVKDYGAVGDGVTDDTASLKAAIAAVQQKGGVLEFGGGTYRVTTIDNLGSARPVTLQGQGATLLSDQRIVLSFSGNTTDLLIDGFRIETTCTGARGLFGLITSVGKQIVGLKVTNMEFRAPSCGTNAIKLDVSAKQAFAKGIEVSHSRFNEIGQMGVEVINHQFDGLARYEQIRIADNRFHELGRRSPYGQAVSLSGLGHDNIIAGNTIEGAKDIAVELVNADRTTIEENVVRGLQPGCSPLYIGRNAALPRVKGVMIRENEFESNGGMFQPTSLTGGAITGNRLSGTGKISVESCDHLTVQDNTFRVENEILWTSVSQSYFRQNIFASSGNVAGHFTAFKDSSGNAIEATTFSSERQFALLVNGSSTGNVFSDCLFSMEGSKKADALVQFDGRGVRGNVVRRGRFGEAASGVRPSIETNGASENGVER
jgi:hypothetical protein